MCRAAVNRIVNLTESTVASGDDEGCIKVIFHSHQSVNNTCVLFRAVLCCAKWINCACFNLYICNLCGL